MTGGEKLSGREEGSEVREQRPWGWETCKKLPVGQSGESGENEVLRGCVDPSSRCVF